MSKPDELSPEDLEKYRHDLAVYGTAITIRGDDGVLRYVSHAEFYRPPKTQKPRRGTDPAGADGTQ